MQGNHVYIRNIYKLFLSIMELWVVHFVFHVLSRQSVFPFGTINDEVRTCGLTDCKTLKLRIFGWVMERGREIERKREANDLPGKTLCDTARKLKDERTDEIETEGGNAWLGMHNIHCFQLSSSPVTWETSPCTPSQSCFLCKQEQIWEDRL